ncbi:hypothetical protein Tco_0659056 [Tanacetum coccineum]
MAEEEELSEQQKKRKAEVQEAAQNYTKEDWDTIRAKLKANAELTKSLQGESMTGEDFAKRMVEMINQKKKFYVEQKAKAKRSKLITQAHQRDYMSTFIKNQSSWKLTQLKKLTFNELKTEFEKLIDIEDASITKGKDEVVKEEETEVPVKKIGMRRKQKARKGINIDKTAQDEFNKEREAYVKYKVKDASSELEFGVDVIPTATKPPTIGRKPAKAEPTVHKDPAFDELDDDTMDYMETEDAQDVGRTSYVVHEEKESAEKGVSTEDPLSTAQPKVSTDKPEDSTDKPDEGTDKPKVSTDKEEVSTDRPDEGTVDQNEGRSATQTAPTTTTPTIFGDDETIAQVLIIMSQNKEKLKEKEKGVELKDVEETERPRPTSTRSLLTLKPLPKIDPKDKGKKMIEEEDESDTDSEDITEAEKKFKQLARDEEVARKVQEDWEAEEEVKKLAEEEATKAALSNEYDFIQARLNADKILAEKLQEEEREMYTIEQRAKFLHDTIAAQRRFLAQQRSEAIRNKPPSRNQLRNQMMTYLKHVGGKKHSDLKTKGFEEIKALYDKIKRSDDSFIAIGSAEDEKVIKEMNEQVADASKKRVKKDDSIKGEIKEEEGTRKRKLGIRKKMKSKKRKFTSKDDEELRLCLTIVSDEDKEVDYEILDKKYPIIEWRSEYLTTKPQYDETEEIEDVYLNVVIRSNRQRRYFSTLMAGDLIIMFNQSGNDEFWNAQQNWKIVSWKLHSSSGIHTIMTDDGIVIHMLVENKYPLKKEVLSQLLKLKLETEEDNTMALELIRFVKKQIAELEPKDSDGDETDL